jgi:YD repeat-containing protein
LHVRTTTADALGRITKVVEDPGSPVCSASVPQPCHFNYITTYGYDALDDLTGVNQSGQMRTFTYDSLKRLTKAVNPESGTINYAYDLNGNLKTKTDGRPTTVSYGYDRLNRMTGKTYSDGTPAVTYAFDAGGLNSLGHLTSVTNGNSTTGYGPFDANGRPRNSVQTTAGQAYTFGYGMIWQVRRVHYLREGQPGR